ncbi:hypothetical protein [Noviherbaspirillum pedocola]|uniref:Uncharacterized protein n=1 Tax=Noviherbaspirillum pedocola TaxID=2801341 RepID=A0A934T193_9BURK|nr:hypothetical protein [Noviherbaspirillum pedocola]MBK4739220.1 hypothetical protein [Noviherbaspirillum pedocola]
MTKIDSNSANSAKPVVTRTSLFMIASDGETALDHLERLLKMSMAKLESFGESSDKEAILAETMDAQTLLESIALYLKQIEGMVEAVYLQSQAMPRDYEGENEVESEDKQ